MWWRKSWRLARWRRWFTCRKSGPPGSRRHKRSRWQIDALGGNVSGAVTRLGERFVTVPESLQRHYRKSEQVLPVYLQLDLARSAAENLPLGCEVRLPAAWMAHWQSGGSPQPPADPAKPTSTVATASPGPAAH